MHHSRLCALIIDSKTDDLEMAADFWSKALGRPVRNDGQLEQGKYAALDMYDDEPVVEVQKVSYDSRVHIDIESDDVEAEVLRLEQLGAKVVEKIKSWVVMQAPTGHRFCVVRKQRRTGGFRVATYHLDDSRRTSLCFRRGLGRRR